MEVVRMDGKVELEDVGDAEEGGLDVMLDLGSSSSKSQLGWSFRGPLEKFSFGNLSVVFAESWPGWVLELKGMVRKEEYAEHVEGERLYHLDGGVL